MIWLKHVKTDDLTTYTGVHVLATNDHLTSDSTGEHDGDIYTYIVRKARDLSDKKDTCFT